MRYFKNSVLFLMLLLGAGCARIKLAAVNAPVAFSNEISVTRDIAYGSGADHKLDIYAPADLANKPLPVIVFFYGGRWTDGDKKDYAFVAGTLVERGYIVVIPDYAKYPKVKFPVFVEDGAKAMAWVHKNISQHHGKTDQIYLMGHSAGAHIASLLMADPHYLKAVGETPQMVKAFAGLAGPYDFTPDEPDLIDMFGPPENYPKMQATHFITGHEPPMLLVRGDKDTLVKSFNVERLSARIREKGGVVETITYPGMDHVWAIGAFSWAGRGKSTIVDDMTRFFQAHP